MIVVAGAGLAGLQTVVALRDHGYAGPLTLLGAEPDPPYDRPPLSKELLAGVTDGSTLEADWAGLGVELRLGVRATAVDDHVLVTDAGDLRFDRLVLATGALPRTLPGAGALSLRTRGDALRLREVLRPGARLVIVGAGWIGAEVATSAAARDVAVTVVEAAATPLPGALPDEIGTRMLPWWSGVDLRLGTPVEAADASGVTLAGGERVEADAVLVAAGAVPVAVDGVTRGPEGAVTVDATLRTSAPDVLAVGDCAAWTSTRYGTRMHVEHWDNALRAPAVAAANALGAAQVWDPVPYFWSEQWGRMVQYAGHHPAGDHVVWRRDDGGDGGDDGGDDRDDGDRWAAFWLAGDRLVAALTVDRPRDLVQARHLMEAGARVDAGRLADPAIPVRAAVVDGSVR